MAPTNSYKNPLAYLGIIVVIFLSVYTAEFFLKYQERDNLHATLQTRLNATQTALRNWYEQQDKTILNISLSSDLEKFSRELILQAQQGSRAGLQQALVTHPAQQEISKMLSLWVNDYDYSDYYVISPSGLILASSRESRIGRESIVARQQQRLFNATIDGSRTITRPILSSRPQGHTKTYKSAYFFSLAPVFFDDMDRPAVLALQIPASGSYVSNFLVGRHGMTGEAYAFDNQGRFLSESRFIKDFYADGTLKEGDTSILSLEAIDPETKFERAGGGLIAQSRLTKMAESAIKGLPSHGLEVYRDYRGKEVVANWTWDKKLKVGLVAKLDSSEAYSSFNNSIMVIHIYAFVAFLAIVTALYLFRKNSSRRSAQEEALTRARDAAEFANHSKSVFLSSMSHELRTPLNAVIGFGQLFLKADYIQRNKELRSHAEHIVTSGGHLLQLLNEVLEFAKLDVGELTLDFASIDPAKLVDECCAMVDQDAKKRGITIVYDNDMENLPAFLADETKAKQVLVNFLSNAVKYNKEKGHIFIRLDHDQDVLRFYVRDTGKGISADQIGKLWEPFNRLGAENTEIDGSGIGLAFSRKIIEAMGGNVGATSVPGLGSTFWFSLPVASQEILPGRAQEKPSEFIDLSNIASSGTPAEQKPPLKALCVEDMALNQTIMARMLDQHYVHDTTFCVTGGEALNRLREDTFDVILLDINLPDMSGFDFEEKLAELGIACHIPIIVVTADVSFQTKKRVHDSKMAGYIPKPIRLSDLVSAIDSALNRKEPRQTAAQ